ncbi:PREDICTED: fatty acid synthase-like [Cyphomyrmex costatus]|uniref:fatty acid synthase-like n=1 Tax=Cyphomyrmex costatus TaxID=456900 RepID=UPI0008523567|nr:PREDICTED: fatty acid synthase-like [Cyphomyrmex costatus]
MDGKEADKSWNDIDFGETIVISGIAGRFPHSDNMNRLRENLFNKTDLVRADHNRWKIAVEHAEFPKRMGIVNNVEKFDAEFFGLSFEKVHTFAPEMRLLLEHTYEAIIDAGINPKQLQGKNTAVIVGSSVIESQVTLFEDTQSNGTNIIGRSKSTAANVISYCLDLKGPSYTVDTACSSSLYAMAAAYDCIMSGKCEDAIVGTAQLCFHPLVNLQFARLGVLSHDGYCRPFDIAANGYARSETVAVVYLQKAKNAKRIYAMYPYIKLNSDGYKEEGITYPSSQMQYTLLKEFYEECKIPTSSLDYVETHGTATIAGDPPEIDAIYNVMCKNRKSPLMIGSVKSNLGHAEPASGFNQIAKVIIAFETGFVPPNINYTMPRKDIDALLNGSVCVVQEPMPVKNGYIGISSFGFGGSNAHMLLRWNPKQKINNGAPNDDLPRLVTLSGRNEESVKLFLNDIANQPIDVEYIRLLHDIYADNINGHPWRGYIILNTFQEDSIKEIQNCRGAKRPVWFIFSALGSQWPGMGQNLLKFHTFAKAIKKCDNVLKPYGISVIDILTKKEENICKNAINAFLGIVAIQIGLVDFLTCLGITPDYMIGHSAGELVCAYADKCLTIEQTILSAYFIGLACAEETIIQSSMAIVNIDYKYLKNLCPADIEIVCHNSENSCVVCGPKESIEGFMKELQVNNIYVKEINCNIPFHSSYVASAERQLSLSLHKIIPHPKKRSSKWISTSIPRNEWFASSSKLSSAVYHSRSILNTVLFHQTTDLIPRNAVVIEIAPDDVLQHVLSESLHPNVTNLVLTHSTTQNVDVFLQGIGKLYNCGLQPQIAKLYPPVQFPVSRGTPMISPLIRWNHSENWFVPSQGQEFIESRGRYVKVKLEDEDYEYMNGHVIDGRNLLPATGYLGLVWKTIGMMKGLMYTTIPIVFRDVKFIRATYLSKNDAVELYISIQTDGKFEITEGESVVVTGTVYETLNPEQEMISIDLLPEDSDEDEVMTVRDIYKELKLRGYQYKGLFRGLKSASVSGNQGHIAWKNNWETFMDTMLQMVIIGYDTRDLCVPTSIQKLVINPVLHASKLRDNIESTEVTTDMDKLLRVRIYKEIDTIKAGGVEIRGLQATQITRRKLAQDAIIEENTFVAHCDRALISLNEAIRISAQLVLEDHQIIKVQVAELVEDVDDIKLENLSSSLLIDAFGDMPLVQVNIALLTSLNRFRTEELPQNFSIKDFEKLSLDDKALIVAGFNLLTKQHVSIERLLPFMREGGYLLTREKYHVTDYKRYLQLYGLNIILEKRTDAELIVLLKKNVSIRERNVVYINNDNFSWLEYLKQLVNDENKPNRNSRIIIVGEKNFECGLLGFVNCLRKEPGGELVRGVLVQDEKAPKFSLQDPFYLEQLQKDMTINVLRSNKTWGSYRHIKLPRPQAKPVATAHVCQMVRGDLNSFCWIENNLPARSRREDLVHVVYASLNFKDVMLATGKLVLGEDILQGRLSQYLPLGMEYVGFDANGQRIMGIRDTDCIANVVEKDENLCWKIPDAWTFEEAVTVPCVYSTVCLALYYYGKMKKGDKVLIHSGTGGIGQAAIHLALQEGCDVFTTVGTTDKRDFVKKIFPIIPDEYIGNSRDTSFEHMIMRQTKGRGVDIVLNSLAEEKLIASVRCLVQNGRFLEIGKFDIVSNNPLSMSAFQKGISFHGIRLENVMKKNSAYKLKPLMFTMIKEGLENRTIKPIQTKIFPKTDIEEAFRYMASGKHTGKIIINIHEKDEPLDKHILAYRRYYCLRDRNYVILGGLGGFGLELTDWLIFRGARNIVLVSRNGIKNGYQRMKVRLWKSYGINVLIIKNIDVADLKDCEYLLRTAEKEASVDAIFNLGVVLKDGVLKNQTAETFTESFQSKARATQMLDKLSRKICLNLRHFVVFSSVSCGRGNAGQTNYGMANSIMERICEKRAEEGLPGLAIQWGAVGDVGLVADMQEDDKELIISGTLQQKISSCLNELDKFLLQSRPIVSSMVVAEKKVGCHGLGNLAETVANILDISDIKVVSLNSPLAELGMDSMMTVEIKQTLEREFDVFLTAQEIRNLTFAKLIKMSVANVNDDNVQDEKKLDLEKSDVIKILIGITVNDEDFISQTDFSTNSQGTTTEVFLIPGIDGCGTVFNLIAPNIKFPTSLLHYNTNNINCTTNMIKETTKRLTNHILPKLTDGKDFVMVGYSFGSLIAIEVTRILETMNFKGRLVLIDGAPELARRMFKPFETVLDDADFQIDILTNIMEIYSAGSSEKVSLELKKCETWDERYNIFAKQFSAINTSLSSANLKTLCITVYKHLSALRQYDPSTLPPIKSPIILLKCMQSSNIIAIEEDFCLHKVTENVVNVHYIEGDHVTILKNEKVTAAVNGDLPFTI